MYFYYSKSLKYLIMKLNCVVVDDSSIQRMIIAKLVNNHPNLHLIGIFLMQLKQKLHVCAYCRFNFPRYRNASY
jgi:hypothetical protein